MKEFLKKHYSKLLWGIPIDKKIFKIIREFFKENSTDSFYRIPVIVIILGVAVVFIFFYNWLGLGISAPNGKIDVAVIIYRNRGFALAAIIGISLAIWGRWQANKQIALNRKANASERYEKAAHMLGDKVLAVRIAGCHALENLAIDDEKMTTRCIQLLSTFIVNPLADKDEIKKSQENERLRQDTQAALNGLSAISRYYCKKSGETVLNKADLTDTDLRGANLIDADLRGVILIDANLTGAHLSLVNLIGADLWRVDLRSVNLRSANLNEANLTQANLAEANLTGAELRGANLTGSNLAGTYLTQADLTGADLTGTDLTGADLAEANLAAVDLISADLTGADLTDAELIEADLDSAKLINADLRGADLGGADLSLANLKDANLTDADLTEVNLTKAGLKNADLKNVKLENADLAGADLRDANNLTKSQILSAKFSDETPPYLSEKLLQTEEIQTWLAKYQQENEDL